MSIYNEFVQEIESALRLMESLDSSHKVERFIPSEKYLQWRVPHDKEHGITQHTYHKLDGGEAGIMHVYKRDKAYEIHHEIWKDDGQKISGHMIGNGKPNPKFVGTMYNAAQEILKKGQAVRIVGNHTNGMFDHYNRIAHILAKRNNKFVSDPQRYTLNIPGSEDYSEITIHGINENHIMRYAYEACRAYANKSNNYMLGDNQSWLNPMQVPPPKDGAYIDFMIEEDE